jgi:hypothetical protein
MKPLPDGTPPLGARAVPTDVQTSANALPRAALLYLALVCAPSWTARLLRQTMPPSAHRSVLAGHPRRCFPTTIHGGQRDE